MDRTEAIEIRYRYKELLFKHMSFNALILFGSYTKRAQRENSGIDVAIVVDETTGDYFETRPIPWKINRQVDDRIEPVTRKKTPGESRGNGGIRESGNQRESGSHLFLQLIPNSSNSSLYSLLITLSSRPTTKIRWH